MVVKHPNVGLGVVEEGFYYASGVDEVVFEEGREGGRVGEERLFDAVCELFQGSHLN